MDFEEFSEKISGSEMIDADIINAQRDGGRCKISLRCEKSDLTFCYRLDGQKTLIMLRMAANFMKGKKELSGAPAGIISGPETEANGIIIKEGEVLLYHSKSNRTLRYRLDENRGREILDLFGQLTRALLAGRSSPEKESLE